jgi:hypothetical protein
MKAVLLGNTRLNYSWFILSYRQGLRQNGVQVYDVDYKSNSIANLKKTLTDIKPDLVFTHLTFHTSVNPIGKVLQMYRDVTKATGAKFIHTCNDARTEDRYMGDISDVIHSAFVGSLDLLYSGLNAWDIPVYYAPYSSLCYEKMARPVDDLRFQDPVFTGSPTSHKDRHQFLERIAKRVPIRVFQTQSAGDLRNRTPELSASAKCILGLCTGYDVDGYIDVRPFQYLGTGACMIMRKFKNMDAIIPPELYYPLTSYGAEGADQFIDHWNKIQKTNTTELQQRAFKYMQQHHSCKVRIQYVLEKIKHHG